MNKKIKSSSPRDGIGIKKPQKAIKERKQTLLGHILRCNSIKRWLEKNRVKKTKQWIKKDIWNINIHI